MVTQRLHVDDLVGHLLEQGDWTELNLPAIAEVEQIVPLGPGKVPSPQSRRAAASRARTEMGVGEAQTAPWAQPILPPSINRSRSLPGGNLIKWSWFRVYDNAAAAGCGR